MSTIEILYEGVDITPYVEFSSAYFEGRSDGQVGAAFLRIKDEDHTFQLPRLSGGVLIPGYFHTGGTLECKVDGTREWRGWVMSASWTYAFPVDDTSVPADTPRYWTLNGVDLNIHLQRRYLYRKANPADASGLPVYAMGTTDRAAIIDMLTNYVEFFPGDLMQLDGGVPDATYIQTIGSPGEDEDFRLASVSMPIATMFTDIVGQTGGVFYIDPDGYIHYVDDETVTAPFELSDQPSGGQVGYREMEVTSKGDLLGNDALVWGAGRGSADPVFSRYQNAASIALHGRFQWADQFAGAFLESTVAKRAETYVEGSVLHRRGHKDDQDFLKVVIFEQGIRPAMVVAFHSEVYDYHDDVPVRASRLTFPTPSRAKWELQLGHNIDVPYAAVDDWSDPTDPPPNIPCTDTVDNGATGTPVFGPPMEPYLYDEWVDWGEWRDVEEGPGETWAHGEYVVREAPVDPYGRWAERWWSDIVYDDPESPGYGNTYPDTPPPGVAYTRHFGFRDYQYAEGYDPENPPPAAEPGPILDDFERSYTPGWGTASSGHPWASTSEVNPDLLGDIAGGATHVGGAYGIGTPYQGGLDAPALSRATLFLEGQANRSIEVRFRATDLGAMELRYVAFGVRMIDSVVRTSGIITGFRTFNEGKAAFSWGDVVTPNEKGPDYSDEGDDLQAWHHAKFDLFDGVLRVKGWIEGQAEPSWTVVSGADTTATFEGITFEWFVGLSEGSGWNGEAHLEVDWIDTGNSAFCTGSVSQVDDTPVLEDEVYHTRYPYEPGSLRVFVNGGEIFDFEETSPSHGEFTIGITVLPGIGEVTCRYRIAGTEDGDNVEGDGGDPGGWRWPTAGRITQEFGCTGFYLEPAYGDCAHFHDGIDIANVEGTPVYAPVAGTVTYHDWSTTGSWLLSITADSGLVTRMGHLVPTYFVSVGQRVAKGQRVGTMGNTGNSTGPHTHWEVYNGLTPIDPRSLL